MPGKASSEPDAAASAFWTKYAYFVPSQFADLPGWRDDDVREAWKAFRQTCNVLGSRSAWHCHVLAVGLGPAANDSDDIRRFIEREFALYQIHNKDRSVDGVITGYYEPLLNGSRRPGQGLRLSGLRRSRQPAVPRFAQHSRRDRRLADLRAHRRPQRHSRVPGQDGARRRASGPTGSTLATPSRTSATRSCASASTATVSCRISRARRSSRVRWAARSALLWVNDVAALYSMQVQGSGKIRLPDGQIVRLAYGEQNGHPFTPPVRASRKKSGGMLTRGIALPDDDDDAARRGVERASRPDRNPDARHASVDGSRATRDRRTEGDERRSACRPKWRAWSTCCSRAPAARRNRSWRRRRRRSHERSESPATRRRNSRLPSARASCCEPRPSDRLLLRPPPASRCSRRRCTAAIPATCSSARFPTASRGRSARWACR